MPVYILISDRTFSAAESFTFGSKINDRVTLVGERTGGHALIDAAQSFAV